MLRIACMIPVTLCDCERTAKSSLRRLHMFTRALMARDRLSSLALIHIHCHMEIDLDEVVTTFSVKEPRRMQLTSILRDRGALFHFGIGKRQPRRLNCICYTFECCTLGL